jgi:hypothetical protein
MSFAQRLSSRDNSLSNLSGSGSRRTLRGSGKTRTPQPEPRRDSGQQSESSSERRLSFFRSLFERRKNDYHADVQEVGNAFQRGLRHADRTVGAATTVERSSPPPEMLDEEKPSCFSCLRPSQPVLDTMSCIIEARLWRVIIFLNTLLLLFGSEIQDLCIPKGGDIIMDVFYTIAMAVFFFDMMMRCFLEQKYMPWCGCAESKCVLGSFLFWCDLFSTLTLLYNVTYVNKLLFKTKSFHITLNELGIPVSSGIMY